MNKKKADELLKKMKMTYEMAGRMMDGTQKLETVLEEIVEQYQEHPRVMLNKFKQSAYQILKKYQLEGKFKLRSEHISRDIDFFKRYYFENKSLAEIALENGLNPGVVAKDVRFIENLLFQRHRREIWYKTI
ncbi:MAG: hypothetical protein AABY00_01180 [Nanoarchaeota archaeon]